MALYAGLYSTTQFVDEISGKPEPGTAVTVYQAGYSDAGHLATLYTDRTKTVPAANPFTVDDHGNGWFYTEPGLYDLWAHSRLIGTVAVGLDAAEEADLYAADIFISETPDEIPITVKAAPSQTGDLTEWVNSSGTVLAAVTAGGTGKFNAGLLVTSTQGTPAPNTVFEAIAGNAGDVPIVARGAALATADVQQWQDSALNVLAKVGAAGDFYAGLVSGTRAIIGSSTLPTGTVGKLHVQPVIAAPTFPNVTVRAGASQTSNMEEWQNSAGVLQSGVNPAGQFGIGIAPASDRMVQILGGNAHPGSAITLYGIVNDPLMPVTTTTAAYGYYSRVRTAASGAPWTMGIGAAYRAATPILGANSTITNSYGMFVDNMGVSGVTNTYGIWITAQSAATTNNYAMVVASLSTGMTIDGDGKRLAMLGTFGTGAISINTGTHTATGVTVSGIDIRYTAPTTATTGVYGVDVVPRLSAGGTYGTVAGFRIEAPVYSTATVTNAAGFQVPVNLGAAGITNAYGVLVTSQSGAVTNNACIATGTGTTASLWVNNVSASSDITGGILFTSSKDAGLYRNQARGLTVEGYSAGALSSFTFAINGATSAAELLVWNTAGSNRWAMLSDAVAETGSNAGSAFEFRNYDDTGTEITPRMLTITRSSGLWDFFAGKFQINSGGQIAVGTSINNIYMVNVSSTHPGSATSLYGVISDPQMPSTTTVAAYGVYGRVRTAAAAFTLGSAYAFRASQPVLGAASAITTAYGLYVQNMGQAGTTNAYGIWLESQSGAATQNLALVINAVGTYSIDGQGRVGMGSNVNPAMLYALGSGAAHPGTGVSTYGISSDHAAPATATTQQAAYHGRYRTSAAAFTLSQAYVFVADTPVMGAGSAITTAVGVRVENQGIAGVTNSYGVFVATQAGATNSYGLVVASASSGFVVSGDGRNMAMGGNLNVDYVVLIDTANHPGTGVSKYGVLSRPTFTSSTTSSGFDFYANVRTQAAAFTLLNGMAFYAAAPSVGAGSTITNAYGMFVVNQGVSGVTNAYGVWIDAVSGAATNNFPLVVTGTGSGGFMVNSSGQVTFGTTTNNGAFVACDTQSHPVTGTTVRGAIFRYTAPATATSESSMFYAEIRTAAAAFTIGNAYNFRATVPTLGAGSAITNAYGLHVANLGLAGIANAYGIWVQSQTGAGTLAIGARIDSADTAALWICGNSAGTTANGGIVFGSGRDVNLYRAGNDILKTDDAFVVGAAGSISIGAGGGTNTLLINGGTGLGKRIDIQTNGSLRWRMDFGVTAEGGANAGADLNLTRYSDAGAVLSVPLVVTRSTGVVKFNDGLQWGAAGLEQTTVGAAGAASALPATPTKYLKVVDSTGATLVVPAYAAS